MEYVDDDNLKHEEIFKKMFCNPPVTSYKVKIQSKFVLESNKVKIGFFRSKYSYIYQKISERTKIIAILVIFLISLKFEQLLLYY